MQPPVILLFRLSYYTVLSRTRSGRIHGFKICRNKYFKNDPASTWSLGKILRFSRVYSLNSFSVSKCLIISSSLASSRSIKLIYLLLTIYRSVQNGSDTVITLVRTFLHSADVFGSGLIPQRRSNLCHAARSSTSFPYDKLNCCTRAVW